MLTAAGFALAGAVVAVNAAVIVVALRGHSGGRGRLGCLRRTAANRAARAVLRAAIAVLSVRAVRAAVLRARWAWRCRGCPPRNDGDPLGEAERRTARPERSRT